MTSGARLSIVVADDDPDDQVLTRDAILESGIEAEVQCVADGVELLATLRADPSSTTPNCRPDLILLDLRMPRMGGVEVLEIIKTDPRLRHIPVAVLTTSNHRADMTNAYTSGADDYIVKPLTADSFRSTVRGLANP